MPPSQDDDQAWLANAQKDFVKDRKEKEERAKARYQKRMLILAIVLIAATFVIKLVTGQWSRR